ncbi:MAG: 2-dehydropantoate 2-reductase [Clostridiales bacterium]|jgi:2-dehydropantoate 2-reductase|nr:2-dehydropantoate 2-reductase [Clostridiales bacterium]
MRTAIYGAGAIGTALGAYITKGGEPIDLISRNAAHIAALKKDGAHITGTVDFCVKVNALLPGEMTGKYDIIFLATKQLDNAAVVGFLKDFLSGDGVICTIQNGLPELSVSEVIGQNRTFGCAIAWGAEIKDAGVCALTSEPEALTFGLGGFESGDKAKLQEIARILGLMGRVDIETNFMGARWSKLLVNSAFSGLSAVLGATFGEVADDKASRLIAQKIIKECIDTAAKAGVKIAPIQGKDVAKLLDYKNAVKQKISFLIIPLAMKKHKNIKASMLQDIEKGKKCEIDAINGVVSQYGKKVGVPTPYNDKVVEIVKGIEQGKYKPSRDNLRLF